MASRLPLRKAEPKPTSVLPAVIGFFWLVLLLIVFDKLAQGPRLSPDDFASTRRLLHAERERLLAAPGATSGSRIHELLDLGLWEEAKDLLAKADFQKAALKLAKARLHFLNNDLEEAERDIDEILVKDSGQREALLLKAKLKIEAWLLSEAANICQDLLERDHRDEEAALVLGRVRILEKKYDQALDWAYTVQDWNDENPGAYLLESDVHFWKQKPELAEAPLKRSLELDPFNADARFNYGYAIWRRVDATQLDDMAAQWKLALEINPLHYLTHWHWGNGHTNLTYADYVHPTDEAVRRRLQGVDSLIAQNRMAAAIELCRLIGKEFPESVLPALTRGSAFYMAYDLNRTARLDSAQTIFESILGKKEHYGPAHNGLAAVIKQNRMTYLATFDSLETVIANARITDPVNFERIFPDVYKYPGDRVAKMVWNSLYAGRVYFPFLAKMNRQYRIPPLHIDLAITMGRPYFRQATTFDNRQWMDIRGVGSGASAIEYVERGAHLERNVVLHEYVHLFHGRVFTDYENRRVRQLYYNAMATNSILDYYSANNESEYLAQTYPAYFEQVKVHPLNHKSINTTAELQRKDPELYAFLDSLVQKQLAYLGGDREALASNWAQVYLRLSHEARRPEAGSPNNQLAAAYLDTALTWDAEYLPAFLAYARLRTDAKDFDRAAAWLQRAEQINPNFAPIHSARAELTAVRFESGLIEEEASVAEQKRQYEQAMRLEKDYALQAALNKRIRTFYLQNGLIGEAVRVASQYGQNAPTISTYLRDRRDEALAFSHWLKGRLGYTDEPIAYFRQLVSQKPQHYDLRGQFAEVLEANGQYDDAITILEEAQRILEAAGQPSPEFTVKLADYYLARGDTLSAQAAVQVFHDREDTLSTDVFRLPRALAKLGRIVAAQEAFAKLDSTKDCFTRAEYHFTNGQIKIAEGDISGAIQAFRKAIRVNRYHTFATVTLTETLLSNGQTDAARMVTERAQRLPLKFGPAIYNRLDDLLGHAIDQTARPGKTTAKRS